MIPWLDAIQIDLHKRYFAAVCLLAMLGAGLVLFATSSFGVAIWPDSVDYLSTASNLVKGRGFVSFSGEPFAAWPPLYPTILALAEKCGSSPEIAARFVDVFAFAAFVLLSGFLAFRLFKSTGLAFIGVAAALVSYPVLGTSLSAVSEPLFIVLELCALLSILTFQESNAPRHLVWAALFAALCCLTRYIGVAVVLACGLAAFDAIPAREWKRRLISTTAILAAALIPLLVWCARNYAVSGTLTGVRGSSSDSWVVFLADALDTLVVWFVPHRVPGMLRLPVLLLGISFLVWINLRRNSAGRPVDFRLRQMAKCLLFFLSTYLILLVITLRIGVMVISDTERYLAPAYPMVIGLALISVKHLADIIYRRLPFAASAKAVLIGLLCLWLIYPTSRALPLLRGAREHGPGGYSTLKWKSSPLMATVAHSTLSPWIVTNDPYALYALAGIVSRPIPFKTDGPLALKQALDTAGEVQYVWFKSGIYWSTSNVRENLMLSPEDLRQDFELTEISHADDGAVFRIGR